MLSQIIPGTKCSLSHFLKTSYLLWQQQSGKGQKKEGIKKKEQHASFYDINTKKIAKTELLFVCFCWIKLCYKSHLLFSHPHRRSESFLLGQSPVMAYQQSSMHLLIRFNIISIILILCIPSHYSQHFISYLFSCAWVVREFVFFNLY